MERVYLEEFPDVLAREMASVIAYLKENLSDYRYQHIKRVVHYTEQLADRWLTSESERKKALVAALIHDITKEQKKEFHYDLFSRHGVWEKYHNIPTPVLHSKSAPLFAKERFNITDPEIAEAAAFHTTGHPNMGLIAQVVFAADMLGSLLEEEAMALVSYDLQELCLRKVKRSLHHVIDKGSPIHPDTILYYEKLIAT